MSIFKALILKFNSGKKSIIENLFSSSSLKIKEVPPKKSGKKGQVSGKSSISKKTKSGGKKENKKNKKQQYKKQNSESDSCGNSSSSSENSGSSSENSNPIQLPEGKKKLKQELRKIINEMKPLNIVLRSQTLGTLVNKITNHYAQEEVWNDEIEDYIITDDNWDTAIAFATNVFNFINTILDSVKSSNGYINDEYVEALTLWAEDENLNLDDSQEAKNLFINRFNVVTKDLNKLAAKYLEYKQNENNVKVFCEKIDSSVVNAIDQKDRVKIIGDIIEIVGEIRSNSSSLHRSSYHGCNEIETYISNYSISINFRVNYKNSYEVWCGHNKQTPYRLVVLQGEDSSKKCVFFTPDHYGNNGKNIQESSFIQLDIDAIYNMFFGKENKYNDF